MKIECTKCRYVMSKDEIPKRCPYCGQPGAMRKAKVAQDILDEALGQ